MRRGFIRFTLALFGAFFVVFTAEFLGEWLHHGRPGAAALSFANVGSNGKLVDLLSPAARAYNNILAMLLATIGLAIPLTANMHTPKLIEMFLRDRLNQVVLIFGAFGAANAVFVQYLVGPAFAPVWAIRFAVLGVLLGWTLLIPYFFYVVRFVDPSNILARLKLRVVDTVSRVSRGQVDGERGQHICNEHVDNLGTVLLKAIDRGDRGVALEGLWSLKQILDHYTPLKASLPERWYRVDRADFPGFSAEALEFLNHDRTFFEMKLLTQLRLAQRLALQKSPDIVSSISDATRVIAVRADERGDGPAMRLAMKHFNNYVRESINANAPHAISDVFHQYRLLAKELRDHPAIMLQIARYVRYYADEANKAGIESAAQQASYDLGYIARRGYEAGLAVAPELLQIALSQAHTTPRGVDFVVLKARLQLGAFFVERGFVPEAKRVMGDMATLPIPLVRLGEAELLDSEAAYFEVSDRQLALDYVLPERREHLRHFVDELALR